MTNFSEQGEKISQHFLRIRRQWFPGNDSPEGDDSCVSLAETFWAEICGVVCPLQVGPRPLELASAIILAG